MSVVAANRHAEILTQLADRKHVTVRDLARDLEVSEATIRRDLRQLAERDALKLVHGGATLPRNDDFSFRAKSGRQPEAKETIGRLAAQMVGEGKQIFLDSGSTCFQLAAQLHGRRDVSIVAASLRLALEFDSADPQVILLGGQYRASRVDTVGALAQKALEQLRGYIAFIGADGLSQDFGPSASDIESAHLHQLIVNNARETVLLVDDTKFASSSLYRIVEWSQVNKIVTNQKPTADWQTFLAASDIEVIHP